MRIRSYLLLLAAVVLVPGFVAAAIAVDKVREGERQAALRGLRETVRATALLVDGQVQRSLGALTALGHSANLQSGDLRAFYDQAHAIDQPPDVWTLLLDESGTQRLNTSAPFGTPPPPPLARERVARVLAGDFPLVTDVFVGPATKKLLTTIYLPAAPSPAGRFVVAQAFSVDHWKKTALQPRGRSEWVVGVIDRAGKFISRSQRSDEALGGSARPELVAAAAAASEGLIRHRTLEGVDSYDAFTHSALTGWTIAVAAPVDTIEASATQAIAWLAGGIAMALAAALLGASLLSRTLIRAMNTVSAAARALGHGQQPATERSALHEVNLLNEALADAGRLLGAEQNAREAVEAERRRLLDKERAARATAQQENAAKDQFMALLGHELRNPLAAIAGATEVLVRAKPDPTATRHYLGIVQRQNRHLRRIVDDLLEVGRMLSGKIVLDTKPLELAACVRSCVDALRSNERSQAHRLVLDTNEGWIRGDAVRIEQIVNNLVANAIKFSPSGTEVRVVVGPDGAEVRIAIEDRGIGIAPEWRARIFEPFVQGPALPGSPSSGLGIGLALVRQLVELHGGTIEATSRAEGAGSRFVVALPRIAVPAVAAPAADLAAVRGGHVLLVEDNVDARETTAELLRGEGYDVSEAADGAQGLQLALARAPDAIVMDLGLPGRDGFEIAAEMRRHPSLRYVPLIALSGFGQDRDRRASAAAGFDDHLVKPIDLDTLVGTIRRQLTRASDLR